MRTARSLAGWALLLGLIVMVVAPQFRGASDDHQNDQAAITKILETQQSNWNSGNVNAFLEGYWHSPALTFSGSGGIARGGEGVPARYNKNYPDRAAMCYL